MLQLNLRWFRLLNVCGQDGGHKSLVRGGTQLSVATELVLV